MMSSTLNFFKCLVCNSYFDNLLKIQRHVEKDQHDKRNGSGSGPCNYSGQPSINNAPVRKRGMLPIEKVSFPDCFVPLVKVQINGLKRAPPITMQNKRTRRKTPINYSPAFLDTEEAEITAKNKKDPVQGKNICPVPSCNSTHPSYDILSRHLRIHIQAEREELICDSDQPNEQPIHFPKKVPKKPKIFQCKFCLRKERSIQALKCHQDKVHAQERKLKCLHCDQDGLNASVITFIGHMKTCHPNKLGPNNERFETEKPKRAKDLKCGQCKFSCVSQDELIRHVAGVHQKEKQDGNVVGGKSSKEKFTCPVCGRVCCHREGLNRHFHLHLENNPFTCDFPNCNRKFTSHYNLRRHQLRHDEAHVKASQQKCHICGATYVRKETLDRHLRVFHNPSNPKACKFYLPHKRRPTFQMSSTKGGAIKVEAENTGEEINLVDRIILKEDGTDVHIKGEHLSPEMRTSPESHDEPPINVNAANAPAEIQTSSTKYSPYDSIARDPVFQKITQTNPSALNKLFSAEHINRTKEYFTCNECHGVFKRAWTLQLHMRTQHKKTIVGEFLANNGDPQGQSVVLMCALCAYPAKSKEDLATHMESHKDPVVIFKCTAKGCEQVFDSEGRLAAHISGTHPGGHNNVPCNYCDKTFMTNLRRKQHEYKVHWTKSNGDKRKCPICNAAISQRWSSEHTKNHKDEVGKPRCMLCQDTFSCRMALQRHIDCVHLGKPLNKDYYAGRARDKKAAAVAKGKMAKKKVVNESDNDMIDPESRISRDMARKKKVLQALQGKMDMGRDSTGDGGDSRMEINDMTDRDPEDGTGEGENVSEHISVGEDNYKQNRTCSEECETETILGP